MGRSSSFCQVLCSSFLSLGALAAFAAFVSCSDGGGAGGGSPLAPDGAVSPPGTGVDGGSPDGSSPGAAPFVRQDVTVGGAPISVAIADLDGKNGPDIVVALVNNGLSVRLNQGDGTFGAATAVATCPPIQIVLGDVTTNGTDLATDGRIDVIVSCDDGTLERLPGDGNGGFGAPQVSKYLGSPGPPIAGQDRIVLAAWRDDNGPPNPVFPVAGFDLSTLEHFADMCTTYDWINQAGPCTQVHHTGSVDNMGFGAMVTGRLDANAAEAVVAVGGPTGLVFFGIPQGVFSTVSTRVFHDNTSIGSRHVTVGDLDGDTFIEIVTAFGNSMTGSIGVLNGGKDGVLDHAPSITASVPGLQQIAIGDVDGDGKNDVFGATQYGRAVIHPGDGKGGLGAPRDVPLVGYGQSGYATSVTMATADLDRNGRMDAVIADQGAQVVQILLSGR